MAPQDALTRDPEPPASETAGSGAQSILVVDDDPLIAMTMSAVLNDLGHITVEANSAREALEQLSQKIYFDLMITDYAMPTMNGLQLIEASAGALARTPDHPGHRLRGTPRRLGQGRTAPTQTVRPRRSGARGGCSSVGEPKDLGLIFDGRSRKAMRVWERRCPASTAPHPSPLPGGEREPRRAALRFKSSAPPYSRYSHTVD